MVASKSTDECEERNRNAWEFMIVLKDKDILYSRAKISKNQMWNLILWVAKLQRKLNVQLCRVFLC